MAFLRWIDDMAERFKIVGWALLVVGVLSFLILAADRREPFKIIGYDEVTVRRGEVLNLSVDVWRDKTRDCSAEFSRYLFDAKGRRFEDVQDAIASDAMIDAMEARNPGKLLIAVHIPPSMAPGKALLETVIRYRCNKAHAIWPIEVTTDIAFTVTE